VFEQDKRFLASQNETLVHRNVATKELYLNLKSSDAWVTEYHKWVTLLVIVCLTTLGTGLLRNLPIWQLLRLHQKVLLLQQHLHILQKGHLGQCFPGTQQIATSSMWFTASHV
jgi:hypothetical protein